ncbi:hypothetical protein [Parvicella tangerina]|uniref:Uncharacterized protein n=1 Tax=Parvicella tangerina TaxID=2829795 RepID=A0A916NKE0_9FLAO|nr:hypothetical protein [Parvicella tangerina]CAG5087416.1 hypothetical protein CRYO30217_03477 [Parvicella tangerina]
MEKGTAYSITDEQEDLALKSNKIDPKTGQPFFITLKAQNYEK